MNVPIPEEPQGNNADDIWHRHESEIRRLYQTKGLKEVMTFMESKPAFPKLKPKTLIEKLGKDGIRKTIKNEEWAKVYRYCAHYRLEDPSRKQGDKRLKRTKRRTEVLVGNKRFTWDHAWKNMKRAGAIMEIEAGPPSPLPTDIVVRTPPPHSSPQSPHSSLNNPQPQDESITTMQSQELSLGSAPSTLQYGTTYLGGGQRSIQQYRLQTTSANNPFPSTCLALRDCIKAQMMVHLPSLPIWNFSNAFAQMANLDLSSWRSACDPWYDFSMPMAPNSKLLAKPMMPLLRGIPNDSVFNSSDLLSSLIIHGITHSSAALATFSSAQQRAYITIALAIYIFSNNLVVIQLPQGMPNHREIIEALDSAFSEIPARYLQALIQSRLTSVRAAFEAFLDMAGLLDQRVAFKSLVKIGTTNKWLANSARGHNYLYVAVRMGLYDVVQQLLESGCRPEGCAEDFFLAFHRTTAIIKSLERDNLQCVRLLLKYCDVNKQFQLGNECCTNFTFFIERGTDQLDEMRIGQGIMLFIDAGADVDSLFDQHQVIISDDEKSWSWLEQSIWSVQDYLFCFHRHLFYRIKPNWDPARDSRPTRAGFLMSAELGPNALGQYFSKLAQNVEWMALDEYLELLVAEQLTGIGPRGNKFGWREVDLKTVGALVDFGVSMDKVLNRAPFLLANYMQRGSGYDLEVIRYLLDNGATVDDRALKFAVQLQDTVILALLVENTPNIRQQGIKAAVEAATDNNFEAVKMLLDAGVDVNAEFEQFPWSRSDESVSLLFHVVNSGKSSFDELRKMIDFLVQRGAHLRLSARRPRLSDLLESVLKSFGFTHPQAPHKDLRKKIAQHIIDAGCDVSDPDVPSARLLEACAYVGYGDTVERMELFESMFRNRAALRPGSPLAAWIYIGGGSELVNEMLSRGVEINAFYSFRPQVMTALQAAAIRHSLELVALLLQNGANVNAPARGRGGATALQAICCVNPESAAEAQQIEIINLLIRHGANINAAPARVGGSTALQNAAQCGNLEVVILLLSCEPPADVNAPPGHSKVPRNALDSAADNGRLDVVKLLVNNGGISSCPGETGYDGAIRFAEEKGFLAVAELLRQHAMDVSRSNTTHTSLSQPKRDWHEYEYDDYSDGYTTLSEDDDLEHDDCGFAASSEEQDSLGQGQIQPNQVEHPGAEHAAREPGRAWEVGDDNSLNFDMGFDNLADDIGSTYDLEYDPTTSHVDAALSGSGLNQWLITEPNSGWGH